MEAKARREGASARQARKAVYKMKEDDSDDMDMDDSDSAVVEASWMEYQLLLEERDR